MLFTRTTTATISSLLATAPQSASHVLKRFQRRSASLFGVTAIIATLFLQAPGASAQPQHVPTASTRPEQVALARVSIPQVEQRISRSSATVTRFFYRQGYYLDNSWLCYGWSNGAYHCTQHWHRDASGRLISDNPAWVPASPASAQHYGKTQPLPPAPPKPAPTSSGFYASSMEFCHSSYRFPAYISQWTIPVSCYSGIYGINPAAYPYRPSFGWCNWWPEEVHPHYSGYSAINLPSHSTPIVGAVVWFAPGVQGAGAAGHYANVVAIGPNGWLLISEMNFYWRGGGFGKVDYRYVHVGYGVSFRY